MAMTISTVENRFARLLALHELVHTIGQNNEGELSFLADNKTLNTFMRDAQEHMQNEADTLAEEIGRHALHGEFSEFKGLMDSIVSMAEGQ